MTPLERLVLAVERRMNDRGRDRLNPAWGEDVKVMGLRCGAAARVTVACAMIGGYLSNLDDYLNEKTAIEILVRNLAVEHGFPGCSVEVNTADNPQKGMVYLTVTGTSAEAGDDGQVGRGNRVNGLITPNRPMTLEAVAGKNPVTHVGKIYNVVAREIAETLVEMEADIVAAQCFLASHIGTPIKQPTLMHIKLATRSKIPVAQFKDHAEEIARGRLARTAELVDGFMAGTIDVF